MRARAALSKLAAAAVFVVLVGFCPTHIPPPGGPVGLVFVDGADFDVNSFKHKLGMCSQLVRSGKRDKAVDILGKLISQLKTWKDELSKSDADKLIEDEVAAARAEPIDFFVNTTYLPKKCTYKSRKGDVLKVHFVGKLLPSNKVFDSSFHTGSMPYRFVLGSKSAKVAGWNKGLVGMCKGERRTLMISYDDGYGDKGAKGVPPYSNLKYMVELVELSNRGGSRSEM